MSSPHARSVSRGRSRTPAKSAVSAAARSRSPRDLSPAAQDNGPARTRSRTRSGSARAHRSASHRRQRTRSYSRSPTRSPSPDVPRSAKIVVEKLTKNVHAGHLREIFGSYGVIQNLDLPLNMQFMTNKGTATIIYASPSDAEAAIAHMHEAQLDGAAISVSIVLPRRRFSRSPPMRRAAEDRFGEPRRFREPPPAGAPPRPYGGRPRTPPPYVRGGYGGGRSPPPQRYGGRGGGGGYRERYDDRDTYRPRSYSRSRSPRRTRSVSPYSSRSRTRSPPRRRLPSPPRGGGGGGRRRRSPSYSSYSGRSHSQSRSRDRGGGRR